MRAKIGLIAALALGPALCSPALAQDSLHMRARSILPVSGLRDVWGYRSGLKEYALACAGDRLEIIDCSVPDTPQIVRTVLSTSGDLKDVKTYLNYAYAVNQNGPVQIINLANPAAAFTQAQYSTPAMPSGHNIYIDANAGMAYASLNGSGARDMRIISLASPTDPVEVGHFTHPDQGSLFADAHDAFARNDTAWVSYLDGGLAILDITNEAAPTLLAMVSYPQATNHNVWVADTGYFVYTTDERAGGHVRVWDTRDLRDIRQVAEYTANPSGSVHNVHIRGDLCFISYYTEGVRILDIEDPALPIEVAYYDTYPTVGGLYSGCWGVYPYAESGLIYASDRTFGLFVLEWDGTRAGRIEGEVRFGHSGEPADGVAVTRKSTGRALLTGAPGLYSWRIGEHPDTLIFERAGFYPDTIAVSGLLGVNQTLDVTLQPLPTARVAGTVSDASGVVLAGARVGVMGEELFEVETDAVGRYVLDFVLADSPQVIAASRWGYRYDTVRVTLGPGAVFTVDFELVRGFEDNFELDLGWTSGATDDDAASGFWERVDPVGTQNFAAYQTQPEHDYDAGAGTKCWVTGQATPGIQVTVTDVDAGQTSLVSPYFRLSGITDPLLTLRYWYVNNAGASPNRDTLWFELSADSGKTWVDIGSTRYSLNKWWSFSASLASFTSSPAPLLFRVRAVDGGDDSVIEVAVDGFEIEGTYGDVANGDFDQSGLVNAADVIYLVNFVFKGGEAPLAPQTGDVNSSCSVTSGDIVYLVNFVFKAGPEPLAPCGP